MSRTSAYSISLLLLISCSLIRVHAQDTIPIPLKIHIGMEVSGPIIYYTDKNIRNTEGYISVDFDEKKTLMLAAGYLDYKYTQYNYTYLNSGFFIRTGIDFNLLKPDKSLGRYWAGIGLRYGLSLFNSEVPTYKKEDYWGTTSSSIEKQTNWGHFLEVSPGVRAEIFRNFSIGWSVSVRMLLHTNTGKDLKPIYFPGFGNGTKTISTGLSYFIVWNIPYKKINAIIKKEVPEETEDKGDTGTSGNKQQGTGIRQ
jgi:hypothetical protein